MSWRLAVGQLGARLGAVADNLERCRMAQHAAAARGARLLVLPEAILTGYVFESRDAARASALDADCAEIAALAATAMELNLFTVVGFIERAGDRLYNAAMLIEPSGERHVHRKSHLPCLGGDRFMDTAPATAPKIIPTELGNIGISICYELRFPEVARCLALAGADVIAQPMNVTTQARMLTDDFTRVRACENTVYIAVADRGDTENGANFVGGSQIVGPDGTVLAAASRPTEIVTADIELGRSRNKKIVRNPGEYEVNFVADRRPDLYGTLVARTG
jgi:5-aminopentanamidase